MFDAGDESGIEAGGGGTCGDQTGARGDGGGVECSGACGGEADTACMLGTEAERAYGDGGLVPGLGTAIDCLSASSNAVRSAAEYPTRRTRFRRPHAPSRAAVTSASVIAEAT